MNGSFLRLFTVLILSIGTVSFALASTYAVESRHHKIHFKRADLIPRGPNPVAEANCKRYTATEPRKRAKGIQDRGWAITSDIHYGPFNFVSFVGSFESITSGMCIIKNTNIAIFHNGKLMGFFYTDPDFDTELSSIRIDNSGAISVYSGGGVDLPSVEIILRDNKITLDTPSYKTACKGDGIIPKLTGQSIFDAREKLFSFHWRPSVDVNENEAFIQNQKKGPYYKSTRSERYLPELDTCSGTGLGFCKYVYERTSSYLYLTTISDGGIVVYSQGFCK